MAKKKLTNKLYASLLGIGEVQRLNLRLMEIATFNNFDGYWVVKDLLNNRNLWQACIMDREKTSPGSINLIKLRDIKDGTEERVGYQVWNIDTLFILATMDRKSQEELLKMAKKWWGADEIEWIDYLEASKLLGGAPKGTKILRVWWD